MLRFTIRDILWLTVVAGAACAAVILLPDEDNVVLVSMDRGAKLLTAFAIFAYGAACYAAGRFTTQPVKPPFERPTARP